MGKFIFTQTEIPGVVVIEPQVFGDDRGYFMETYQKDQFAEAGIDKEFVQDNQSRSTRGGQNIVSSCSFRVLGRTLPSSVPGKLPGRTEQDGSPHKKGTAVSRQRPSDYCN